MASITHFSISEKDDKLWPRYFYGVCIAVFFDRIQFPIGLTVTGLFIQDGQDCLFGVEGGIDEETVLTDLGFDQIPSEVIFGHPDLIPDHGHSVPIPVRHHRLNRSVEG